MKRLTFILLCFILLNSKIESQISTHFFNYKGYSTCINDDAVDENGNHLLVGEIHTTEVEEEDRDTSINRIFNIKGKSYDNETGILIFTDKNYKVLQIRNSFIGKKVIYDSKTKEFIIGSLFFDYIKVGEKSFSAWQPVIVKIKIDFYVKSFFVVKAYSCILTDFFLEKDEVTIFTRSNNNTDFLENYSEKAEVIKVSLTKFHRDSLRPWVNVFDEKFSVQTAHNEIGRVEISAVQKIENDYYFTTSNLNQSTLKNENHLYRFEKDSLHEITFFPEYLKYQTDNSDWANINGLIMKSKDEFTFLTHIGASKKAMYFFKTDKNFNYSKPLEIPLKDYADYNKIIELSDGNYLVVAANEFEKWSYFLYNSKMEIIKEIDSKISSDYYPTKVIEQANKSISCLFYVDNTNKKDCFIQILNLK